MQLLRTIKFPARKGLSSESRNSPERFWKFLGKNSFRMLTRLSRRRNAAIAVCKAFRLAQSCPASIFPFCQMFLLFSACQQLFRPLHFLATFSRTKPEDFSRCCSTCQGLRVSYFELFLRSRKIIEELG